MLNTILVALDMGESAASAQIHLSTQVIEALQALHLRSTTQVIFSHIVSANQSELDVVVDRPAVDLEAFPYDRLEKQLQSYQKELPCQSKLEIGTGDPAEEIIRLANIYDADLIVIGSRGLRGMQRILLGSVSSQIVADAPCSVLVVKPR
ncbi:MAG: universal stress protein [Leptolyngbyaceae cyanobacterium CSU_1_3]|nr:universal stress protein [Leptolyngbyaceae cyanobacterium CSU_1_3]